MTDITPYLNTIPKGWIPLVKKLHGDLVKLFPDYEIHQVKDKFGALRFYANPGEEWSSINNIKYNKFQELISKSEHNSTTRCEECGNNAVTGYTFNNWIRTLCGPHWMELGYDECRKENNIE